MNVEALMNIPPESWLDIFSQLDLGILVTDAKGKVLFCTEKYIEVCRYGVVGLNVDNIKGMTMHEVIERANLGKDQSAVIRSIRYQKKVRAIFSASLYRFVLTTAVPGYGKDGTIQFIFNVVQDEHEIFRLASTSEDIRRMYMRFLEDDPRKTDERVVFVSEAMKHILDQCLQVSDSDLSVLMLGESGVGKDVVSRTIHENSRRKDKPFIAINCGAIPENLIESELFGYEPGAFTGASKNGKMGAFEAANMGTIMLDEIGDLSLSMQVKLLRVLENRQVVRIGSVTPVPVNFRLISATNKNLMEQVQNGAFRKDLYYRINAFRVVIPPLRERLDDVTALATHYLSVYNLKYRQNKRITSQAINELSHYKWPGNIRELRNVMEQLVVLGRDNEIGAEQVRAVVYREDSRADDSDEPAVVVKRLVPMKDAVAMTETQLLEMVRQMEHTSRKAADLLGVDQTTVLRKMKKHSINGFR